MQPQPESPAPRSGVTVNVRSFGVVGDGKTDDTAAVQAVMDSLPDDANGWEVYFPAGTYYITRPIQLPGPTGGGSLNQKPVHITGHGATLYTDQAISIFKRWPAEATANNFTLRSYVIAGLIFKGTALRSQVGLDLGGTYGAKIANCYFIHLGIGMRLTYAIMTEVTGCFAIHCVAAGFFVSDGFGLWSSVHTWASSHVVYRSCRVYALHLTPTPIVGLSRANPCVVAWPGHGLVTGEIVFIDCITQPGWTALNHRRFLITKVDDDSFSLRVMDGTDAGVNFDTSAYAQDYAPASTGVIHPAMFGFQEMNTFGNQIENCITEGSYVTDDIFFYSLNQGASLYVRNHYVENTPYGAVLYLNFIGGKIDLYGFGSNLGSVVIDAFDVAAATHGVVEVKDYQKGSGPRTIRLPQDNPASALYWIFSTGSGYGYGYDMLDPAYWYGGVVPGRVSNYLSRGYPILQGSQVLLQGGLGTFVKQETHFGAVHFTGADYQGLRSEANSLGGGGVGAYDIDHGQAIMLKQLSRDVPITAAGAAYQDLPGFIPAGVMVVGFTVRVLKAIGGASSLSVGEAGSPDLWLKAIGVAAGTTGDLTRTMATAPRIYAAATTVRLTANGGKFNGAGEIRLAVHYLRLEAPAS